MVRPGSLSDRSVSAEGGAGGNDGSRTPDLALERSLERALEVPVDMASLEAAEDEKRELLDAAAAAAVTLMAEQAALPAAMGADDGRALASRFYAGDPAAEVVGHDPRQLPALALSHVRLAARRSPGSPL